MAVGNEPEVKTVAELIKMLQVAAAKLYQKKKKKTANLMMNAASGLNQLVQQLERREAELEKLKKVM